MLLRSLMFFMSAALVMTACVERTSEESYDVLNCEDTTDRGGVDPDRQRFVEVPLGIQPRPGNTFDTGPGLTMFDFGAEGLLIELFFDGQVFAFSAYSTDGNTLELVSTIRIDDVAGEIGPLDQPGITVYDSGRRTHPTRQLGYRILCETR